MRKSKVSEIENTKKELSRRIVECKRRIKNKFNIKEEKAIIASLITYSMRQGEIKQRTTSEVNLLNIHLEIAIKTNSLDQFFRLLIDGAKLNSESIKLINSFAISPNYSNDLFFKLCLEEILNILRQKR